MSQRHRVIDTGRETFKKHTPTDDRSASLKKVQRQIDSYLKINQVQEQDVEYIFLQDIKAVLNSFRLLKRDTFIKSTIVSFCHTVSRYLSSYYSDDRRVILRRLQRTFGVAVRGEEWESKLKRLQEKYGVNKVSCFS
jgi:hypothetical protein